MSEWIVDGPGVAPPTAKVLLDEVRHGVVRQAPTTFTFPRVGDGDHLPIGDGGLLLFHGRPKWYLTVVIAVSQDNSGASPLRALLTDLATSDSAVTFQAQAVALATGIPDPQCWGWPGSLRCSWGKSC